MTKQAQTQRAHPLSTLRAATRVVPREDAAWSRPIFRPPPLDVAPARPEIPYLDAAPRTEPWAPWPRESASLR